MIKIKVPATSANLGPGFDILGIALNLYNVFTVDYSDELIIKENNQNYSNENNLFYLAFKKTNEILNINKKCFVDFTDISIPFSRGLGSSAALIVGGIYSANALSNNNMSTNEILDLATKIEGHPDNVAPAILGGLTISSFFDNKVISKRIDISNKFNFTVFIPKYEVSTEMARQVIKQNVPISDSIYNTSHALLLIEALKNYDIELLKFAINDKLHVPYRKKIIKEYEDLKSIAIENGAFGFTISGSGPTMIAITDDKNFSKRIISKIPNNIKTYDLQIDLSGVKII